jgi:two-component system sensor histidine kinase RegB
MRFSPWMGAGLVAALFISASLTATVDHQVAHALEAFAAAFSAFLVARLGLLLRRREAALEAAAAARARGERLAALATLAAGAAHELATPLSTLSVVARRLASATPEGSPVAHDAALIRGEIERCREILARLQARSDDRAPWEALSADAFVAAVRARVGPRAERVSFHVEPGTSAVDVSDIVIEAVAGVVDNAIHAAREHVDVVVAGNDAGVHVVVADDGEGIAAKDAPAVGEPFFTTKADGTGLGLFLARVVCERLGGELVIESGDAGTTVLLDMPRPASSREALDDVA